MANTVAYARSANTITVVFDGSTAWDLGCYYRISSFEFIPSGNAQVITVRNGSATGAVVFKQQVSATTGASDQRKSYEHGYDGEGRNIWPYVKGDEVSAGATLIVKYL